MVDYCKDHGKEFEAFCLSCKHESEPMCSFCLCEHNKKYHQCENVHIQDLVKNDLVKVRDSIVDLEPQKKQLKIHHQMIVEVAKSKDDVKKHLEAKLEKIKNYWDTQEEIAASQNSIILKCHEQLLKEIAKCEHRIKENAKDPERIQRTAEEMMKKQKYWNAYNEVQRALKQDAKLDETEINVQYAKYQELFKEYKKQYEDIERSADVDLSAYQGIMEKNEKLTGENKKYLGTIKRIIEYRRDKAAEG